MGLLIEGRWHDQWYDTAKDGRFQREQAQRRHWITADGSVGPSGDSGFAA
jgi:putative glutathione S-transferase